MKGAALKLKVARVKGEKAQHSGSFKDSVTYKCPTDKAKGSPHKVAKGGRYIP